MGRFEKRKENGGSLVLLHTAQLSTDTRSLDAGHNNAVQCAVVRLSFVYFMMPEIAIAFCRHTRPTSFRRLGQTIHEPENRDNVGNVSHSQQFLND